MILEREMEMDEDMDIESMVFEVREIDLEYEFDAARWYDFTRMELPAESQVAECWFHSAPSYPPSPFVTNLLLREEVFDDKTEASTNSEDEKVAAVVCEKNREIYQHIDLATSLNKTGNQMRFRINPSQQSSNLKKVPNQAISKGLTASNHKHTDKPKLRPKSSIRPTPRSSTLMRPTASQLAKQNNASKFHMQVDQIHEKGFCGTSGTEVQAAKRQKLDGGLLCKVADTKQEMSFLHKIPKKDTTLDRNTQHVRAKITIPQEPDFATSQRAHRTWHKNDNKLEQDSTAYRFKARPFNRKIFDAPTLPIRKKSTPTLPEFQEFHLKTSERAMQHSSAVTTRSYQANGVCKGSDKSNITDVLDGVNRESRRPTTMMDIPKHNDTEGKHAFKARPLNKKILSSRGDMGIFKNSKREPTVPLEFSFQSEKRVQQDLPTDLFSKLSIKTELQPNNRSHTRFPQPKGSKENRLNSFQAGNKVTRMPAGKPISSGQQIQYSNNGIIHETNQRWTASRSLSIR